MKYSKQRVQILNALLEEPVHPTAEELYKKLKPKMPNLSLGTVYRNLGQMEQHGIIRRIPLDGAKDRFDGNTTEHYHLHCKRCGRVVDITCKRGALKKVLEDDGGCQVEGLEILFYVFAPSVKRSQKTNRQTRSALA